MRSRIPQLVDTKAFASQQIVQVVFSSTNTQVTSASAAFIATGLAATITPKSSKNRILITFHLNGGYKNVANTYASVQLLRDATLIQAVSSGLCYTGSTAESYGETLSLTWLDSPASTSALNYNLKFNNGAAVGNIGLQWNSEPSTICLMELQG